MRKKIIIRSILLILIVLGFFYNIDYFLNSPNIGFTLGYLTPYTIMIGLSFYFTREKKITKQKKNGIRI